MALADLVTQNYTLGRGKLYFSRFKTGTQAPSGFRYIGNTPEFSMTIESENLDHFNSDEGIREKDDSVPLETTRTGSLITDNIHPDNIALFFFGESSVLTTAAAVGLTEELLDTKLGHSYKLGLTANNPSGYRGIDAGGFNVAIKDAALVAAELDLTFTALGSAAETITIGSIVYTLRAVPAAAYDVDIGADESGTAANLVAAINKAAGEGTTYGTDTVRHPDVTASAIAGVVTVVARKAGTVGNAVVVGETSAVASWAGGGVLLAGGTGASYAEDTDYTINRETGRFTILTTGSIADGADLDLYYDVRASTRDKVISGSQPVEGALMFEAYNPKGNQIDYYMPWVKITPNGDYALKGDEWQQIPFNLEALKPTAGGEAILADGRPFPAL